MSSKTSAWCIKEGSRPYSLLMLDYHEVQVRCSTIESRYVYGVQGIAETFGCSIPTANRIKASGVIDDAITQVGRKIVVDPELAIQLVKEAKAKGKDVTK